MASPIGSQGTFRVQSDDRGSSIDIHISERAGIKAENLSLSTWGASFVLANLLHRFRLPSLSPSPDDAQQNGADPRRPLVIELGAGTGLVGLSAAALWRADVVLTDLELIVPGIAASVSLNQHQHRTHGLARCGTLDWTRPREIQLLSDDSASGARTLSSNTTKANIILAADVIYSEDHPELLVRTISTWLAPTADSRIVLCYPLRMAYIDHIREFWDLMVAKGLECIEEGREIGDEDWNEVPNTPYEWCVWGWRQS